MGTVDGPLVDFYLAPTTIELNGTDVSGTTVDGIAVGDQIRMVAVGDVNGKELDIVVVIDEVNNLDDNGFIQLDADPAEPKYNCAG